MVGYFQRFLIFSGLVFVPILRGEVEVGGAPSGRMHVVDGGGVMVSFAPTLADERWAFYGAIGKGEWKPGPAPFEIEAGKAVVEGSMDLVRDGAGVSAKYDFVAREAVAYETLCIAADFDVGELAGGEWEADGKKGAFPAAFGKTHLFAGEIGKLVLKFPRKPPLVLEFAAPTMVLLQDDRQWADPTFTLRIGRGAGKLAAGQRESFSVKIAGARLGDRTPAAILPHEVRAGDGWVPLKDELEIEPGSALDFSGFGFVAGPCGEKGRVVVSPEGRFACSGEPGRPLRFYGVNFCFSAQYLPGDKVDRLLDRIVRLGYNTVRIHHYERELTRPPEKPGFDWDPEKVDQLDYFIAACGKRGIWVTTDLFVSRPVSGEQIGRPEPDIPMDLYKILVPVSGKAFEDWKTFARKFLDRVNPHTGKRLADDPTIAWISLVNEGPLADQWGRMRSMGEWREAWGRWIAGRYPTSDALVSAWRDAGADEDPATGSVEMPADLSGGTPRSLAAQVFVAETERETFRRMRDFLRGELKCEALLTNINNGGPTIAPLQLARVEFDYVDDHFYVDHPRFLEKPWQLPSRISNANPIASGATGGLRTASVRLFGKPFTVTEYNYSGPGRFRGVGGILVGALGSLQGWDAMWRFAYSHNSANLFEPARAGYFDLVSDPLNQAADRLALLLYLRGDASEAKSGFSAELSVADLERPAKGLGLSPLRRAAWFARVGSAFSDKKSGLPPGVVPISPIAEKAEVELKDALARMEAPEPPIVGSQNGEIRLDTSAATLVVDTPRSAGGFAESGQKIEAASAGVRVENLTAAATVFVNSLDDQPIRGSGRLLVTHLTDLQNSGSLYAEAARKTLLDWGGLPHLVREGSASVSVVLEHPERMTVWSLATSGRRVEKVPAQVEAGRLVFSVDVRGQEGARMLYEICGR